jgi:FixJ family two-component response regulator
MSGIELLEKLHHDGHRLPAIMITGNADVGIVMSGRRPLIKGCFSAPRWS